MGLALRASLAGAILAIAACGTSFSSAPADAGSTADVTTTDAGSGDTSPSDGPAAETTPGDGPVIVGDGPAGASWCATHPHIFCEDFDEFTNVQTFLNSWTPTQLGAEFTFDQNNPPSPPNALRVATTTATSTSVNALVVKAMPITAIPPAKQVLAFDLRIDMASGIDLTAVAAVAALLVTTNESDGAVSLAIGGSLSGSPNLEAAFIGPGAVDGGPPTFGTSQASGNFPTPMVWAGRYTVEIDYTKASGDAGPSACVQIYAGVSALLSPCLALPPSLSRPTTPAIAVGIFSAGVGKTGNVGVAFDDVTYDTQ